MTALSSVGRGAPCGRYYGLALVDDLHAVHALPAVLMSDKYRSATPWLGAAWGRYREMDGLQYLGLGFSFHRSVAGW